MTAKTKTPDLRLLQTTDLHMHILPFDYSTLQPALDRGLAQLQAPIAAARADGVPTILCDTGDFLQGNALADRAIAATAPHPMIAAFNAMKYDAIVLGNHDFDYGVAALRHALADLDCPVLAANLDTGAQPPISQPTALIPLETDDGLVNIGLIGLTTNVPRPASEAGVTNMPTVSAACQARDHLVANGADIIVALCHFGLNTAPDDENLLSEIARLDGIDVICGGHTHDTFPGPDVPSGHGIDPTCGRVHGVPTVMAGAFGREFGCIDIWLKQTPTGIAIDRAESKTITPLASPTPPPLPAPGLLRLHEETIAALQEPVANTATHLTTAFNMIAPDQSQQLLAQARMDWAANALSGTPEAEIPLLGSAAPYRAGGKDAPHSFLNIPPGVVTVAQALAIFPFEDPIGIVRATGGSIKECLERSAARFCRIDVGEADQPLLQPGFAPYDFKTFFGLTYKFDLSQPVGDRVRDLRYDGSLVTAQAPFLVATSTHRSNLTKQERSGDMIDRSDRPTKSILKDYLASRGTIYFERPEVWRFVPLRDTSVTFASAPKMNADHLFHDLTAGALRADGLQDYVLHLG